MPLKPGEPVYFLSLELQNVGAFGPEKVVLDLSDGHGKPAMWTLILGENGIGKTTALECFLALTPLPVATNGFDGPPIHAFLWLINGQFARVARKENYEPMRVDVTWTPIDRNLDADEFNRLEMTISRDEASGNPKNISLTNSVPKGPDWPGRPIYGYRAGRDIDFDDARFPELPVGQQRADPKHSLRVYVPISVDEWLVELHHSMLAIDGPSFRREYDEVRSLLMVALPGVSDIRSIAPKERGDIVRMEYLTEDGWVSYENLGLGYRSVMGLIGDLAYRLYSAYPNSPNPLQEPAVVLIDEIDLHLHPTWQRQLISTLSERFSKVQFIATAHSPLMVQAAAGHNLVLLYRDPETKQVRVDNEVDRIANWRLDQIVTSDLFGVPSAVRPQLDPEIKRRDEILAKETLTDADREEIRRIEAMLGDVPLLTSKEGERTENLLKQVLSALQSKSAE